VPEAVDVGSVLGGRYKVTAYVLASAEKDLVLDGVDQVLNRPVSILVASADHAAQVATSARELATGDRNESVQVLDLSITDGSTYLVTNRASAADLLDLIVRQDPPAQHPYVEPFFTDTLGSEIFGGPRSTEPETYDDEYEEYDEYEDRRPARPSRLSGLTRRFGRRPAPDDAQVDDARYDDHQYDDTSALPPLTSTGAAGASQASNHRVPPPPARKPGGASAASAPSTGEQNGDGRYDGDSSYEDSRYDDGGRQRHDDVDRRRTAVAGAAGVGAAAAAGAAVGPHQPERAASRFPLSGRGEDDDQDAPEGSDEHEEYDDDAAGSRPFTRVLVGVVLTIVLLIAVVLAATQLSSISGGNQLAGGEGTGQAATGPAEADPTTAPPTPTAEPTPEAVEPVVAGISRLVPDNPGLDAANDGTLPLIIDGNPSTYWGNQVYASDTFGGLATSLALVVELEEVSTVSEVSIAQLNGSGGSFTVSVNDTPSLEGAEQIAQGGFTGPTVTLPIPEGAEGRPTGGYVIVNFTQLPRLNIQAQYPFGVRIGEIAVG
jgi:hypothetical protein